MDSSTDANTKKISLEELSKEELITKCKSFLTIAQKAKQAKDVLIEENNKLKEQLSKQQTFSSEEIIERLTQQKVDLLTALEELKSQKIHLDNKFGHCESQLHDAESKISELDTANQSYKRRVDRLTEENEQLIVHLDQLEKQIEELRTVGLQQQEQLLALEKNNILLAQTNDDINQLKNQSQNENDCQIVELQNMLSVSLEEVKYLKSENIKLNESLNDCETLVKENEQKICLKNDELLEKNKIIDNLQIRLMEVEKTSNNEELLTEIANLNVKITELQSELKQSENNVNTLQEEVMSRNTEIEKNINVVDDLKIELHKNKALVEKLQQDILTTNNKLSDNQIMSSGVTSDLQNANEKLREKLKLYHSKIIRFANDIKHLKQTKIELLSTFKTYTTQVSDWKERLNLLLNKIESQDRENKQIILQNQQYKEDIDNKVNENEKLLDKLKEFEKYTECFGENEKLKEFNKLVKDEMNLLQQKLMETEKEILNSNEKISAINKEKEDLEKIVKDLQERDRNLKEKDLKEHNNELEVLQNQLISDRQQYESEIKNLQDKYENEKVKFSEQEMNLNEESQKLIQENDVIKENIARYLEENKNLLVREEMLKSHISDLNIKIEELSSVHNKLEETQCIVESLRNELNKSNLIIEDKKREISNCEIMYKNLENKLNEANTTEQQLAEKSGEEILNQVKKNDELLQKIKNLEEQIQRITNIPSSDEEVQTTNDMYNFEEIISSLKRENAELLSEMNEMNQALKERGETISSQEALCDEMLKKLQSYEVQSSNNKDTLNKKDEVIENLKHKINSLKSTNKSLNIESLGVFHRKDDEINQLKLEIQELKDRLSVSQSDVHSEANYAESENMSTSTISRMEDMNRMKDLDSSWEERYGKLRNLAVKLKGKIRELTGELQKEQADKSELQQKQAKTIQTFQSQIDKLQDDYEISKSECNQYLKKLDSIALDVSKDKKQLADNDELISQLKSDIDGLNKEKTNTDNWKKQVSAKVQALKKELEANTVLKKEFENRVNKLNAELETKDKALKQEIEKHCQTKTVLQESNNECKKQSVLNLEMQDYERSVKELSQKIEKKQELINKLKSQLETQKTSLNTLKDQNQELEDGVRDWEDKYDKISSENEFNKKKIMEFENILSEKDNKLQDLTYTIENIRSDNEDLSTQLSKAIAEHQKINNGLKDECDHLKSRNMGLEQTLREVQGILKLKEQEFSVIQEEYQGYKVRAQSVLRQNQSRDVGFEEKLAEEAASLRAQVEILTNELKEMRSTLNKTTSDNNKLETEAEKLRGKIRNLEVSVEEYKASYEQLFSKHQQIISDHAETVRGLKVHSDTIAQCYRQQLSEQETRHNREIIELQSKMDRGNTPPENSLVIPSMPREEGEGSESVDSIVNNRVLPIPLEKLLGSETEHEVTSMRKQLSENESKVIHLTALLADTEQDLAKYVQLNNVLKEEIRRQQRSAEREKHAENLEYLKNVVFKFITLGNGDERTRLVPVLNTILKLSPEETQKLNNVARGEKGWANYLPISWGSPNKPQ